MDPISRAQVVEAGIPLEPEIVEVTAGREGACPNEQAQATGCELRFQSDIELMTNESIHVVTSQEDRRKPCVVPRIRIFLGQREDVPADIDLRVASKPSSVPCFDVVQILQAEEVHVAIVRMVQWIKVVERLVLTIIGIRISRPIGVRETEAALHEVAPNACPHHPCRVTQAAEIAELIRRLNLGLPGEAVVTEPQAQRVDLVAELPVFSIQEPIL